MNPIVSTVLNTAKLGLKLGAGVGATQITTNICNAYMPANPGKWQNICLKLGVITLSSVASSAAGKVIDEDFDDIEKAIEELSKLTSGEKGEDTEDINDENVVFLTADEVKDLRDGKDVDVPTGEVIKLSDPIIKEEQNESEDENKDNK